MNPTDIAVAVITAQMRPFIPHNCPPYLASLMQSCWDENPQNRPTFQNIVTELRCMMEL